MLPMCDEVAEEPIPVGLGHGEDRSAGGFVARAAIPCRAGREAAGPTAVRRGAAYGLDGWGAERVTDRPTGAGTCSAPN
jgi:hypothetical protein